MGEFDARGEEVRSRPRTRVVQGQRDGCRGKRVGGYKGSGISNQIRSLLQPLTLHSTTQLEVTFDFVSPFFRVFLRFAALSSHLYLAIPLCTATDNRLYRISPWGGLVVNSLHTSLRPQAHASPNSSLGRRQRGKRDSAALTLPEHAS